VVSFFTGVNVARNCMFNAMKEGSV